MAKLSKSVSFVYRVTRTAAARLYYLRRDLEFYESYQIMKRHLKKPVEIDRGVYRAYKKMWGWSRSVYIPKNILEVCSAMSGRQTPEYLPDNVYFSTIDPILNNKQMASGYSEKGNYSRLYDIDNEPVTFFKNLNGLFFDISGHRLSNPDSFFTTQLEKQHKILVKPSTESWGGRNVLVFERDKHGKWQCVNDSVELTLNNLQKYYTRNYVVQEYVEQHAFYKRLNPSSFNTFRIYVYRSPVDEVPHVLHSVIRVGKPGSVVDNVKAGGVGLYVRADGTFVHGHDDFLNVTDYVPAEPAVKLSEIGKAPGIEAIHQLARHVALKMPFTRLVAFDINLDQTGKPRLIELNTSNAGLVPQFYGSTFFGDFTQEVIEHCKKQKVMDFLRV